MSIRAMDEAGPVGGPCWARTGLAARLSHAKPPAAHVARTATREDFFTFSTPCCCSRSSLTTAALPCGSRGTDLMLRRIKTGSREGGILPIATISVKTRYWQIGRNVATSDGARGWGVGRRPFRRRPSDRLCGRKTERRRNGGPGRAEKHAADDRQNRPVTVHGTTLARSASEGGTLRHAAGATMLAKPECFGQAPALRRGGRFSAPIRPDRGPRTSTGPGAWPPCCTGRRRRLPPTATPPGPLFPRKWRRRCRSNPRGARSSTASRQ